MPKNQTIEFIIHFAIVKFASESTVLQFTTSIHSQCTSNRSLFLQKVDMATDYLNRNRGFLQGQNRSCQFSLSDSIMISKY